jgi:hypothetical protein
MSPSLHEDPTPLSTPPTSDTFEKSEEPHISKSPRLHPITEVPSHISQHIEAIEVPIQQYESQVEVPDSIYNRFSPGKKITIVAILSLCSFLTPISSTTVLSAIPEVASEYNSTGTIINLTNALYLVFMGISPCFWGPLSQVYGRRTVSGLEVECERNND